jgi:hypothetical protein
MDAYKIGMSIVLSDGVSAVLGHIAAQMAGIEGKAKQVEKGLAGWNKAIVGGVAILGGAAVLGGLKNIADHGDKLLDQQDKLQRNGVSYNEVLRLQKQYYDSIAKAVPTSTVSDYLKQYNELRSVVGAQEAEHVAPWSMKLEAIIANATGKKAEGEGFKMWRAMEMTGRTMSDPAGVERLADALAKNIVGSGGKLDAGTYQTMAKRGGTAWANASPEFLAGPMSVVGADLGGDTAGTAMMSAYMFMTGANTLSKQQYGVLKKAGLIDPNKAHADAGGRVNVDAGGIVGSGKYTGNGKFDMYGWTHEFLEPALTKLSKGDRAVFDSFIAKVGRNRNVMRMLTMFSDPGFIEQIDKDLEQWKQAHGVNQSYDEGVARNPKMTKKAFGDQYDSMMESIGAPMMQAAIPVMKSVTDMFTKIGGLANSNPDAVKSIGEGIAALGAGLLGAGGVALLAAIGPAGWLVAGIAALGTAAAMHKKGDWLDQLDDMAGVNKVREWGEKLRAMMPSGQDIHNAMMKIGKAMDDAIAAIPGMVSGAISSMASAIGSAISSALAAIPGMIKGAIKGAIGAGTPSSGVGDGGEDMGANVKKPEKHSSYVPPPPSNSNTRTASVYLDGRKVGKIVEHGIGANNRTVTASNGFDSAAQWAAPEVG